MVSNKVVVILLIIAIILSAISLAVTLSIDTEELPEALKGSDDQQATVKLEVRENPEAGPEGENSGVDNGN